MNNSLIEVFSVIYQNRRNTALGSQLIRGETKLGCYGVANGNLLPGAAAVDR
jgi:hypothetical protein